MSADALNTAVQLLSRALDGGLDAGDASRARYELARCYIARGHPEGAVTLCEAALEGPLIELDRVRVSSVLASALESSGRLPEAQALLERILGRTDIEPAILPPLYMTLGLVHEAGGRLAQAQEAFDRAALAVRAGFPAGGFAFLEDILSHQAGIQHESGNVEGAIRILEDQLRTLYPAGSSGWHRVHSYLGAVYTAMEKFAEARECYECVLASPRASDYDRATARTGLAELVSQRRGVGP